MEIREEEGCGGTKVRDGEFGSVVIPSMLTMAPTREIQIFLVGYIVIEICTIFTIGGFPLDSDVRKVGRGVHWPVGAVF